MTALVLSLAAQPLLAVVAILLAGAGTRAGDRPGDVRVRAAMTSAAQPDSRPVVAVAVHNPGPEPVLMGLTARAARVPGWLAGGISVSAPRRTTRQRLQAGRHEVVGVAAPGETAHWLVPVARRSRRYCLVAVAGQAGGRLRVIRLPVPPRPVPPQATRQHPGIPQFGP